MYFVSLNFYFSNNENEIILRNTSRNYDMKLTSYTYSNPGNASNSISSISFFSKNSQAYLQVIWAPASIIATDGKTASWLTFRYKTQDYLYATPTQDSQNIISFNSIRHMEGIEKVQGNRFIINQEGYYYINLVTCPGDNNPIEMACFNNNDIIPRSGILRNGSFLNDVFSKAFIHYFKKKDIFSCQVFSGIYRGFEASTLTMFKLNTLPSYPVIFASIENDFNGEYDKNPIPFDKTFLNENFCWNSYEKELEIKISGIYFLYLGVGSSDNTKTFIEILINDIFFASMEKSQISKNFEIISRTLLLKLNFGDKIKFQSRSTTRLKSKYFSTSFIMFYVSSF